MLHEPRRREFLWALSAGAVALAGPRLTAAADAPLDVVRLAGGVSVVRGPGGSNVVVAEAPDALLLVNGDQRSTGPALLDQLRARFGGRAVTVLVNTDWHPSHSGLNEPLRKAGATVLAHQFTKEYQQRAGLKTGLPTKTFYTTETLTFGGQTIECQHLGQAHTDGDISVFLRGANVLVVGDMLSVGKYPIPDVASGGWLGGMMTATKTLLDLANEQTQIVPGSGAVQPRAALDAQHRMLSAVRERFVKMMRQGMSADDMLAGKITQEFDAQWGDPTEFIHAAYKGMWLHVRELGGIV
jgi:glyoxylase-like metal-dependent hydrolase (beta-lactamase superfamily II)